MIREDVFMDMMEAEMFIVQLKARISILSLQFHPITKIVHLRLGDKFHLFFTLDFNLFLDIWNYICISK